MLMEVSLKRATSSNVRMRPFYGALQSKSNFNCANPAFSVLLSANSFVIVEKTPLTRPGRIRRLSSVECRVSSGWACLLPINVRRASVSRPPANHCLRRMQRTVAVSLKSLRDRLNLQRVFVSGFANDATVLALRRHGLQADVVGAPPAAACPRTSAALVSAPCRSSAETSWAASGLPTCFFDATASVSSDDSSSSLTTGEGCLRADGCTAHQLVAWLLGHEKALERGYLGFGPHSIQPVHIFAQTKLSFAIVNIKPVLPGHVLVVSRRRVARFSSLTPGEVSDLWCLAQTVSSAVSACHPGSSSATFAIQDGPAAGQTVPHVHIHVIPRKPADLPVNDAIYDLIEAHERDLGAAAGDDSVSPSAGGSGFAASATASAPIHTAIAVDPPAPPAAASDGSATAGAGVASGPAAHQRPTAVRSPADMQDEADRYRAAMAAAGFVDFTYE